MKKTIPSLQKHRIGYHQDIFNQVLVVNDQGIPNNADKSSKMSVSIAKGIVEKIIAETKSGHTPGQTAGKQFENVTLDYIRNCLIEVKDQISHAYSLYTQRDISKFEQYEHLIQLDNAMTDHPELKTILGDYIIKPDIVLGVKPLSDESINKSKRIIDKSTSRLTPMRLVNNSDFEILHASISCKWTLRSDRSQNARTEGLNLIRNRKGHTPHIMLVTAEPYPNRIASVALGTGDIDCVYHFALYEMMDVVKELDDEGSLDMLNLLIKGKRLRDISDLPLDLLDF
ncbi:MAG: NgoMIV family type II restriction endonuclease [Candidatus Cloacimonetes bacterium]|nr:NgoMIV family type II restriction endonuclease [Candidatus Cloacimonadota bacterium]